MPRKRKHASGTSNTPKQSRLGDTAVPQAAPLGQPENVVERVQQVEQQIGSIQQEMGNIQHQLGRIQQHLERLEPGLEAPKTSIESSTMTSDSFDTVRTPPVTRGLLKEADRTKFKINYKDLVSEIDGNFLVADLISNGVITFDDKEEIQSGITRFKRAETLLQKIWYSGPEESFGHFLNALANHYGHLYKRLQQGTSENEDRGKNVSKPQGDDHTRIQGSPNPEWFRPTAQQSRLEDFEDCKKYPNHDCFFPLNSFAMNNLPKGFHNTSLFEYIHNLAGQVVLIQTMGVSVNRPEGYPFHEWKRFTKLKRFGTGRVWRVLRKASEQNGAKCPCQDCAQSESPKTQWGQYLIVTAKVNVYDEEECRNTTCILWYDTDEIDPTSCPSLKGLQVKRSDMVTDSCEMVAVTHDLEVAKRLEKICDRNGELAKQLFESCFDRDEKARLAITVSHPHGFSKRVSVGMWGDECQDEYTESVTESFAPSATRHSYTAPTCAGSSGAPVLLLDDRMTYCAAHSGYMRANEINFSGGKTWPL